ncbi:MAG TPA: Gfo/Idh/MocA family oxidoreductase [Tepidisphaeraceae bacterium]|jgi:predicted dehydrogenase
MAIRIGVIGCGAIAQRRHLPEAQRHPDVELVAVCDPLEARAKEIGEKFGAASTYTDHRKLLAAGGLDAIIVATPNTLHAAQSIDALAAGCHVLVEKPMAATLDEGRAMIDAAAKAGKFLMVGQNQRLMSVHVKAKKILDRGDLGKPITFQTTFKHPGPDGWSVDGAKSWFFRKAEAAMGVCGDLGVHKVDLMRYLLGQEIVEVNGFIDTINKTYEAADGRAGAKIDVDDNAFLSVKTDAGVLGTINISWTNYGHFEDNGTTIYCENGVLVISGDPQYGVIVHYRDGTKEFHKTGAVATNTRQVDSGVLAMFANSIKANRQPPIDGPEGYRSLQVILAAFESAASGKTSKITPLPR